MNEQLKLVLATILSFKNEINPDETIETLAKKAIINRIIKDISTQIIINTSITSSKNLNDRLLEVHDDEINFIFNSLNKHSGN